jgi:hypothetical protein
MHYMQELQWPDQVSDPPSPALVKMIEQPVYNSPAITVHAWLLSPEGGNVNGTGCQRQKRPRTEHHTEEPQGVQLPFSIGPHLISSGICMEQPRNCYYCPIKELANLAGRGLGCAITTSTHVFDLALDTRRPLAGSRTNVHRTVE